MKFWFFGWRVIWTRLQRANDLFPVNSLFLYMLVAKCRNPCGFSYAAEKIPCYFPCYQVLPLERLSLLATDHPQLTTALPLLL